LNLRPSGYEHYQTNNQQQITINTNNESRELARKNFGGLLQILAVFSPQLCHQCATDFRLCTSSCTLKKIHCNFIGKIEEHFHELLYEELHERFEGFHPGHYGVDDIEITFDQVNVSGAEAVITGNIYASARLEESSAKDGMDVDYRYDFERPYRSAGVYRI